MPEPQNEYLALREQIEILLTEGQQFGKRAAEWEKVETYWNIGDTLERFLEHAGGSTYGDETVRNLSKDLHVGSSLLYEILRFRRRIPTLHARVNLGWSHYRALLSLPSERATHYEQLADEQGWSTRQLRRAIESETDVAPPDDDLAPPATPLRPYFGPPFTYRVVADLVDPGSAAIDFGFHHVWQLGPAMHGSANARPGDTVTVDTANNSLHVLDSRPRLWTYAAHVLRVVDGDTLDVVVDLGLGHRAFPRLRLRGIDTPELYTRKGQQARDVVTATLADVPFVLISTRRTDTYGRYLADVKYLPEATDVAEVQAEGIYLNRRLLDEGLAVRYEG